MRLITKRLKVIAMTPEEMEKFLDLVHRAKEGHQSHYAEEQMDDGSYLGVSVEPHNDFMHPADKRGKKYS